MAGAGGGYACTHAGQDPTRARGGAAPGQARAHPGAARRRVARHPQDDRRRARALLQAQQAQRGRPRAAQPAPPLARRQRRGRCRPSRAAEPPRRRALRRARHHVVHGRAARLGARDGLRAVDRGRPSARDPGLDGGARRAAARAPRARRTPRDARPAAPRAALRADDHGRRRRRLHRPRARRDRRGVAARRRGRRRGVARGRRDPGPHAAALQPSRPASAWDWTDEDARAGDAAVRGALAELARR